MKQVIISVKEGRDQLHGVLKPITQLKGMDPAPASYISGDLALVNLTDDELNILQKDDRALVLATQDIPDYYNGNQLKITVDFCLKKRKNGKRVVMSRQEATEIAIKKLGVKPRTYESHKAYAKPLPAITAHGNKLHNVFSLSVDIEVIDESLFNKAVKFGIGTQRSYGQGLVRVG